MSDIEVLDGRIAYVYSESVAALPCVMFLGGFKSDMQGTKALYLEKQCRARGQSFVRFDYSGHGESKGLFKEGTIGQWKNDAREVLDGVVRGDVVLVGSSMGGWIALLLLLERRERIKGIVGIAAAPDFTAEVEAQMNEAQKREMAAQGFVEVPSDYGDEPYIFTRDLIEDGRKHFLLHKNHEVSVPLILLQGKKDADVPWRTALRIAECFKGEQTEVLFIEDGDHRLSRDQDLRLLDSVVGRVSGVS